METEPIVVETGDLKIASASDDAEGIIECCYQLVCSGRPWPEILEEVKRLSDLSKQRDLDLPAEGANGQVIASKERVGTRSPPCDVPFRRVIETLRFPWSSEFASSRLSQKQRYRLRCHQAQNAPPPLP
jgi:hypothetical protein